MWEISASFLVAFYSLRNCKYILALGANYHSFKYIFSLYFFLLFSLGMGLDYWARLSGLYLQKLGWGYRVWCFSFWMGLSLGFLLLFSSLGTYILFLWLVWLVWLGHWGVLYLGMAFHCIVIYMYSPTYSVFIARLFSLTFWVLVFTQ
ncbi:hypothetical protein DFP73DRAFT_312318 [Morchella snyderi]|nr:hypothetical protein DFP73DRAFT_312318 [Morchella snyderi]